MWHSRGGGGGGKPSTYFFMYACIKLLFIELQEVKDLQPLEMARE